MTSGLRVGILSDAMQFNAWQVQCIRELLAREDAEIALIVLNGGPPAPPEPVLARFGRNLAKGTLLWRIYERFILSRKCLAMMPAGLPAEMEDAPQLVVIPEKHGRFRQSFSAADIERLRRHDLDVLLRFGFGILTGDVLETPRYGIWSYHHGDPQQFRGAPPGFWEIHQGSPVTGVVLQRLTERLDGGIILRSGWFKTLASSYPKSLDRILFGAAHFVSQSLGDLSRDPAAIRQRQPVQSEAPVYRYPKNRAMLRFLINSARARLSDQLHSLFRHQHWNLGILKIPVEEVYAASAGNRPVTHRVEWLPEKSGRFLADPFAFEDRPDGEPITILAEEFDWRTGLGHVSELRFSPGQPISSRDAIRREEHLSYPFLFEEQGKRYCVPECAGGRSIQLYEFDSLAKTWRRSAVLVDGVSVLDPTIFRHEGRWWLFASDSERGPNELLLAWHAERLEGPWTPHAGNPIKVDVRSARPAGRPFVHNGDLIRPAQDCSIRYGGGITFNRVRRLTPEEFVEEQVAALRPAPDNPYRAGLHTICSAGGWTVIDGARFSFQPAELRRAISRKLRRIRPA